MLQASVCMHLYQQKNCHIFQAVAECDDVMHSPLGNTKTEEKKKVKNKKN